MGAIFEKYGVSFHLYSDDTLYFPLQHKSKEFLGPLLDCLNELQIWLKKQNLLELNENKTKISLFGLKSYEDCALHFSHLSLPTLHPALKILVFFLIATWVLRNILVQWSN